MHLVCHGARLFANDDEDFSSNPMYGVSITMNGVSYPVICVSDTMNGVSNTMYGCPTPHAVCPTQTGWFECRCTWCATRLFAAAQQQLLSGSNSCCEQIEQSRVAELIRQRCDETIPGSGCAAS